MSEALYLSRARVRKDAPITALHDTLVPKDDSQRVSVSHRLIWTLFGDRPDRTRDFLWREASPGVFYILSKRPPSDGHAIFEIDEPKVFAPEIAVGDRLMFSLRANATIARKTGKEGARGRPCDVVMNALHALPKEERASRRTDIAEEKGRDWLKRQGLAAGFRLVDLATIDFEETPTRVVSAYRVIRLDRKTIDGQLGVLDFDGVLEIVDPNAFLSAVSQGFGRAKAFGCGLMLIRRAPVV